MLAARLAGRACSVLESKGG
ncbi:hypothetical protein A2U01_0090870, partial [Trifolium medium]|nr:hypothetical protein [Trifolium medium]